MMMFYSPNKLKSPKKTKLGRREYYGYNRFGLVWFLRSEPGKTGLGKAWNRNRFFRDRFGSGSSRFGPVYWSVWFMGREKRSGPRLSKTIHQFKKNKQKHTYNIEKQKHISVQKKVKNILYVYAYIYTHTHTYQEKSIFSNLEK